MSKRAEEMALKAYPTKMGMFYEADIHYEADLNKAARIKYIEGYDQAERDLALTWEDVKRLLKIEGDLLDEELELKAYRRLSHKKFCQEVLRRFNELKNKK